MRYFLLIGFLSAALVVGFAGFRGSMSRKPPIELFADMDRQPKLRPQDVNAFFPDGRSSRLPVSGTIARSEPVQASDGAAVRPVYPFEDSPVNTGRRAGATNFVDTVPIPVSERVLARGQERFDIYCAPCHSKVGDGNGVPKKLGAMAVVANLHDTRIVKMSDGELFSVITSGRNLMGGYAAQIPVEDRWAIVSYLRALQLSKLGTIDDVPVPERSKLKK